MRKRKQVAALPMRLKKSGTLKVLLVTSRETNRWVIPKGWMQSGLKLHEAAAREAYEEAGVTGPIDKHPIGSFTYVKTLDCEAAQQVYVSVFPLYVTEVQKTWPEAKVRKRRWMTPEQAAQLVTEPGLISIFEELDDVLEGVLSRLWVPEKRASKRPSIIESKGRRSLN
jgi:8-oxo-dGTP pyrophosphatase MutT (NUDIX family)